MFTYPKHAEFNRVIPKSKIYAHTKPSRAVKELFVSQVSEIVWKYKLSPETTNLPARHGITEIQVFEITLKTEDCDPAILRTIDKAIPFPILFQITRPGGIRYAASYKRPSDADTSKWVIEGDFTTGWFHHSSFIFHPLPVALDLGVLYEQLLRHHIPLSARPGESISEHVARFAAIESKEREARQLESRLAKEKQFNRKVEINAALREVNAELVSLHQP